VSAPVVEVENLRKVFRLRSRGGELVAVDGATFTLPAGGSLGIVGESGSGKTTIARMLIGLEPATSGQMTVAGRDRSKSARSLRERRQRSREMQMVFQNPYTSLDPRQSVVSCLEEVLRLHDADLGPAQRRERVAELLDQVSLDARQGRATPGQLSGGQRQRVAIARALAARPKVIVLDEAVSALDVSIQAQVLNLLADIRDETQTAYIFISHDLAVVRQIADEVVVLQKGTIVERGSTDAVLDRPQHPYTQLLRASVAAPGWQPRRKRAPAA
jgi:ABC-type glutathione transport system ATPase component